jgi:phage-related protein
VAKKIFELAFAIGGQLNPAFNTATGAAAKKITDLHNLQKKNADFRNQTKLNREFTNTFNALGKAASGAGAAWAGVGKSIGKPIQDIMKLGAVAVGAGAGLYALAAKTAAMGDTASKTSKRLGISAQEFSTFAYAAAQSNISADQFSTSMVKLNKNIAQASQGNKQAQLAFKRAGVSIHDTNGNLKSSTQIMLEASDMFKRMPEGIYKADLAMALFGRQGGAMVHMMEQGSDSINKLRDDAIRLGIVFDDETGAEATRLSDNITEAKAAIQGLGIEVGKKLHPMMADITKAFSDFISANRVFIGLKVEEAVKKITTFFSENRDTIKAFVAGIGNSIASIAKGIAAFIERSGGIEKVIKNIVTAWAALRIGGIILSVGKAVTATATLVVTVAKALPVIKVAVGLFKGFAIAAALPAIKIIAVVAAIAAVVAAFVALEKRFKLFSNLFVEIRDFFGNEISKIKEAFSDGFLNGVGEILKRFATLAPRLAITAIRGIVRSFTGLDILPIVRGRFNSVTSFFTDWGRRVRAFFIDLWNSIGNITNSIWASISNNIINVWLEITDFFGNLWNGITGFFGDKIENIKSMFADGFLKGVLAVLYEFNPVVILNDAINKIFDIDMLGIGKKWIQGFIDGVLSTLKNATNIVGNAISGLVPQGIKNITGGAVDAAKGALPFFADGGIVTRPTLSVIGEDGAEAIIPLTKPNRAAQIIQQISPILPQLSGGGNTAGDIINEDFSKSFENVKNISSFVTHNEDFSKAFDFSKSYESIENITRNISDNRNISNTNNNSNYAAGNFNFSPTINVQGGGNSADMEIAVKNALNEAKSQFEGWYSNMQRHAARVAIA